MDFSLEGATLRFSLPDITAWVWWHWVLLGLACNVAWGFVTHVISLPAIYRYRKNNAGEPTDGKVCMLLIRRMLFNLPSRIVLFVAGLVVFGAIFISTFQFKINGLWKMAFSQDTSPKSLAGKSAGCILCPGNCPTAKGC